MTEIVRPLHERTTALHAEPAGERVVVAGKVITAAGVPSGLDTALAAREADADTRDRATAYVASAPAA